jgi:hypothetical protein
MYTVKELIEALKECPEDYEVACCTRFGGIGFSVEAVAIDEDTKTVELYD